MVSRRHFASLIAVSTAIVVGTAIALISNQGELKFSSDQFFALSESDYSPASSFDELSSRSEIVADVEVLEAEDGARFLVDDHESNAMTFLRLRFRHEESGEVFSVDVPRPRNHPWTAAADVVPVGSRAIIYLIDLLPKASVDELRLWRHLPADHYWQFATPQGFVVKSAGFPWYQPLIERRPKVPRPGLDDVKHWMPTAGEKGIRNGQ